MTTTNTPIRTTPQQPTSYSPKSTTTPELCREKEISEMVSCFRKDSEVARHEIASANSTLKLEAIQKKALERAGRIFSEYEDQKNDSEKFNGFDVLLILETIMRMVAMETQNETRVIRLISNNTALEIAQIREDYIFPDYSHNAYRVEPWRGLSDTIEIPAMVLQNSTCRVTSALYLNLENKLPTRLYSCNKTYAINSHIISSFLSPPVPEPFIANVIIVLQHLKVLREDEYAVCTYWNYNLMMASGHGAWSRNGCFLMTDRSNSTHTTCSCNHLTNFAVLMGSDNMPSASTTDKFALSMITYIGCGLSLFGSVAAIATLIVFTGLNSDRNIIHANLLMAIAISQTIFLAGIANTQNKTRCKLTAIMLHYFYLVAFAWMLCEASHLYAMVIKVFNVQSRVYQYVAFAWGLPAVVMAISVASRFHQYGTDKSCWISSEYYTLLAFIIPVAVTFLINVIILCMVMKEICKLHMSETSHIRTVINSTFKTVVVLFPLLGITWVFGLLLFATEQIVFQYIFAVFNSLQGFFIFLLHCLFNSEIRRSFERKKEVWKSLRAFEDMRRRLTIAILPMTSPVTKATASSEERAETFRKSSKTDGEEATKTRSKMNFGVATEISKNENRR